MESNGGWTQSEVHDCRHKWRYMTFGFIKLLYCCLLMHDCLNSQKTTNGNQDLKKLFADKIIQIVCFHEKSLNFRNHLKSQALSVVGDTYIRNLCMETLYIEPIETFNKTQLDLMFLLRNHSSETWRPQPESNLKFNKENSFLSKLCLKFQSVKQNLKLTLM